MCVRAFLKGNDLKIGLNYKQNTILCVLYCLVIFVGVLQVYRHDLYTIIFSQTGLITFKNNL